MRYYYEPSEKAIQDSKVIRYGTVYHGPNDLFDLGTLFLSDGYGIIIVQFDMNPVDKTFKFGPIMPALANDIYSNPGFRDFFLKFAKKPDPQGNYPVMNVRKVMWCLRMKPLRKKPWEKELQTLL